MNHPIVKICGIRTQEILEYCLEEKVDLLGFNFSKESKRKINIKEFVPIIHSVPIDFHSRFVALFYKNSIEEIKEVLRSFSFTYIQYITLDPLLDLQFLKGKSKFLIPQVGISHNVTDSDLKYKDELIILDSHSENQGGGTGKTFAWEKVKDVKRKYLLAGGLNPNNVSNAVQKLNPYGVDVASGVESEPGVKDKKLIKEFIQNVKRH
ncbi:MAG: phosphoribosylanthranilate isomerase [Leptospiraceae bacterium]|nr:phosphoribosylanthranilate isomerase [Leptospiraceae bacterium]